MYSRSANSVVDLESLRSCLLLVAKGLQLMAGPGICSVNGAFASPDWKLWEPGGPGKDGIGAKGVG